MQKIKAVLSAIIGYAGSSENPQKMSLRFMGIIMGVISQFSPLISLFVMHFTNFCTAGMDICVAQFTDIVQPLVLTIACVIYLVGMVRAVMSMPKVAGFLRQ